MLWKHSSLISFESTAVGTLICVILLEITISLDLNCSRFHSRLTTHMSDSYNLNMSYIYNYKYLVLCAFQADIPAGSSFWADHWISELLTLSDSQMNRSEWLVKRFNRLIVQNRLIQTLLCLRAGGDFFRSK